MVSWISKIFLPENPNELCDGLKLILLEKKAGNPTNIINEETEAIVDNLLEYESISTKQLEFLLLKCLI